MSETIPIRRSDEEIRSLERQFNARRPMLTHIATSVRTELTELLADEGYQAEVTSTVLTSKQFGQLVSKIYLPQPLVQVTSQIHLRITTRESSDLHAILKTLATHYQSIDVGWKDDGNLTTLRTLIPPQARPDGYRNREDVPRLMQLSIASSESQQYRTTEGEAIPNLALIMKGGGVKGLAYVGALELLRDEYSFNWFVGTSAGAISAILLAAGFSVEELRQILFEKNFQDFFDAPFYKVPTNLLFKRGMHPAKTFTDWLDKLLSEKLQTRSRVKLGDIQSRTGNRVTVYASQQRKKALIFDSSNDPDVSAAFAARCSMSIPMVFTPESEQGILAFDGGLQNNFPIRQLLDDNGEVPFISLYLGSENYQPVKEQSVLIRVLDIWMTQGEDELIDRYADQVVIIDPTPIGTLDFDLNRDEKEYLLTCGQIGALKHINSTEDQNSVPELITAIQRKNSLTTAVSKRNRRRWWFSWINLIWLITIFIIIVYALAQRWFTGHWQLLLASCLIIAGVLTKAVRRLYLHLTMR